MRAMILEKPGGALERAERPAPEPGPGDLRVRVSTCGVCRTDLHILDGDLTDPALPLIPGHQVVGRVVERGGAVETFDVGQRVGIPWLGWTCGECRYCRSGRENLCDRARFTGYHIDGGYAEEAVVDARFALPLPDGLSDLEVAPLLCGGLIGYRAYRIAVETAGDVARLGLYGFGSAAHMLAQVAVYHDREVYAFTRPGDEAGQIFARERGAAWAGPSDDPPPVELDAAIIFAPVGALVPAALRAVRKGGAVVCGGIHMSEIPAFPYEILWGERVLRSVANLERRDAEEFLALAAEIPIRTDVHPYALEDAGLALEDLREGRFEGSAVIDVAGGGNRGSRGDLSS